MKVKVATALLTTIAIFLTETGYAEKVRPFAAGAIADQQPFDGFPDLIDPDAPPFVAFLPGVSETRAVFEFRLTKLPDGKVQRAFLRLIPSAAPVKPSGSYTIPVEVRSYKANGVVTFADFHRGTFATVFDIRTAELQRAIFVDVTRIIRDALTAKDEFVGFVLRTNVKAQLELDRPADRPRWILVVEFEPDVAVKTHP
jgi:hypothetical protein